MRLYQPRRRETVPAQTLLPAQGSLKHQEARRLQRPDNMAGEKSSQQSLPPATSTIFAPYTTLKYATKNIKNYIMHAAMNQMSKAETDWQTATVKDTWENMSAGDGSDFQQSYPAHGNQSKAKQNKNNKMSFEESYRLELASAQAFLPGSWRYSASWQWAQWEFHLYCDLAGGCHCYIVLILSMLLQSAKPKSHLTLHL